MMNEKYEILAIIPARGGSKSVPRKNLLPLEGKPMIAWAINTALKSEMITRVILTTDCTEIAEVAKRHGADVPFLRPKDISGDLALDVEYHEHALLWLKENENYIPDYVVNLRPTPPARDSKVIDEAINFFIQSSDADSLRSVHLAEQSPFKMWILDERGNLKQVAKLDGVEEPYNQPRQMLPKVYWQDGYVDVTKPETVLEKKSTTGSTIIPFFIKEPAQDIDYPEDIEKAEVQLREKPRSSKSELSSLSSKDERFPS